MKDKIQKQKYEEYAKKISGKIFELFDDDVESNWHIDQNEFNIGDNLTLFIHALSNIAPVFIFYQLTGNETNVLDFNHLSNKLIFQYSEENKK